MGMSVERQSNQNYVILQAKGVTDAGNAAFRVSGMELGGLFGSLLAGRISDYLIAKKPKGGNVGKRVQVSTHSEQRPGSRVKLDLLEHIAEHLLHCNLTQELLDVLLVSPHPYLYRH